MDRAERVAMLLERISGQLESVLSLQAKQRNSMLDSAASNVSKDEPETPRAVQAEVSLPDAVVVTYQANQDQRRELEQRMLRLQKWKFFVEFLAFAGVIAALVFAGLQWREVTEQARTMRLQIASADRAWVVADTSIGSPFTFSGDGTGLLSFDFTLRNVGRSVATGVTVHTGMLIPTGGAAGNEPVERQKALCDNPNAHGAGGLSLTLFPNETKKWTQGVLVDPAEIENGVIRPIDADGSFIRPVLFGCVDYRLGDTNLHHQTGFVYIVGRFDATITPAQILPLKVGEETPALNLTLERYMFGGDYAN